MRTIFKHSFRGRLGGSRVLEMWIGFLESFRVKGEEINSGDTVATIKVDAQATMLSKVKELGNNFRVQMRRAF